MWATSRHGAQLNTSFKYFIMGSFAGPALLSLLGGLHFSGFRTVQRDIGVVLLSGTGAAGFAALTFLCIAMTPELGDQMSTDSFRAFGDLTSGMSFLLLFAMLGSVLIWTSAPARKSGDSSRNERSDDNPYSAPIVENPWE